MFDFLFSSKCEEDKVNGFYKRSDGVWTYDLDSDIDVGFTPEKAYRLLKKTDLEKCITGSVYDPFLKMTFKSIKEMKDKYADRQTLQTDKYTSNGKTLSLGGKRRKSKKTRKHRRKRKLSKK
jgi:hypothetical protein